MYAVKWKTNYINIYAALSQYEMNNKMHVKSIMNIIYKFKKTIYYKWHTYKPQI